MAEYILINSSRTAPATPLPLNLTLSARPHTDIWRKPPSTNVFNAPILYRQIPLSSFRRARVAIHADWKTLYDQGGIILVAPQPDGSEKWVKTGIEFYGNRANVSTVAADRWADWSLLPLSHSGSGNMVTIEIAREEKGDTLGPALWIYVIEGVERRPIREVSWFFEDADGGPEAWIGLYAAKPNPDTIPGHEKDELDVMFTHFVVTCVQGDTMHLE